MGYTRKYFELNRDTINAKRRKKYDPVARKVYYVENREVLLADAKLDRTVCPFCNKTFRTSYLLKHIDTQHTQRKPIAAKIFSQSPEK